MWTKTENFNADKCITINYMLPTFMLFSHRLLKPPVLFL